MAETPKQNETAAAPKQNREQPKERHTGRMIALAIVTVVALVFGIRYTLHSRDHVSTDDAFIEAHVIPISSRIAGHVAHVAVNDNQHVRKGDLLVQIDPRDFQSNLAQKQAAYESAVAKMKAGDLATVVTRTTAMAGVAQAEAALQIAESRVASARATAGAAEADAVRRRAELRRSEPLYRTKVISREEYDTAVAAARSAEEMLRRAQAEIVMAQDQVRQAQGVLRSAQSAPQQIATSRSQAQSLQAEADKAKADLQMAQLSLSYTTIRAPESGRVTRKTVEEGAYMQVGQPLLAIVPDQVWVVANFKETQLTRVRPGQTVAIEVDAYPGVDFRGHVDSIQCGTGSRFSLLPPENATGNYVKVVQRVPVKILFDQQPDGKYLLAPGMSVVPEVRVR